MVARRLLPLAAAYGFRIWRGHRCLVVLGKGVPCFQGFMTPIAWGGAWGQAAALVGPSGKPMKRAEPKGDGAVPRFSAGHPPR